MWRQVVAASQQIQVGEVWRKRSTCSSFRCWRNFKDAVESDNMASKFVQQMWEERQVRTTLLHWYDISDVPAVSSLQTAISHWNRTWQQHMTVVWQQHAVFTEQLTAIVRWSRASWAKRACSSTILWWAEHAQFEERAGRIIKNVLHHRRRIRISQGFQKFCSGTCQTGLDSNKRALEFFFIRHAGDSWRKWLSGSQYLNHQTKRMADSVEVWKMEKMSASMVVWRHSIATQVSESWDQMLSTTQSRQQDHDQVLAQYHAETSKSLDGFLM